MSEPWDRGCDEVLPRSDRLRILSRVDDPLTQRTDERIGTNPPDIEAGDNPFTHEFAHALQYGTGDGDVPVDPQGTRAQELADEHETIMDDELHAAASGGNDELKRLIERRFGLTSDGTQFGDWDTDSPEPYATVANLFFNFPDELKSASPALYQMMEERTGIDRTVPG